MSDSILISTKKILGLAEDYKVFDLDIITHINSALMIVSQLGIGPEEGMMVQDEYTTWDELIQDNNMYNPVKTYVYLRVRILFDPPTTSFLIKALEDQIRELEWRLNVHRESKNWVNPSTPGEENNEQVRTSRTARHQDTVYAVESYSPGW